MTPSGRLAGRTALVTGATSGIGRATARAFVAEGARVVATGRDPGRLADLAAELGDEHAVIGSDVRSLDDLERLFLEVAGLFKRLDVLFVNAGIARVGPIEEVTEEVFDEVMGINLKGAFFTISHALPLMGEGGSIILNGSINARAGFAGASVYSASKAGLHAFARALTPELAARGIRVNTLTIGPVETPLYGKLGLPPEVLEQFATGVGARVPLARFGRPEEVAEAALFLATSDSSYVAGAELVIDGGLLVNTL